jgi:hypothetical protein
LKTYDLIDMIGVLYRLLNSSSLLKMHSVHYTNEGAAAEINFITGQTLVLHVKEYKQSNVIKFPEVNHDQTPAS